MPLVLYTGPDEPLDEGSNDEVADGGPETGTLKVSSDGSPVALRTCLTASSMVERRSSIVLPRLDLDRCKLEYWSSARTHCLPGALFVFPSWPAVSFLADVRGGLGCGLVDNGLGGASPSKMHGMLSTVHLWHIFVDEVNSHLAFCFLHVIQDRTFRFLEPRALALSSASFSPRFDILAWLYNFYPNGSSDGRLVRSRLGVVVTTM